MANQPHQWDPTRGDGYRNIVDGNAYQYGGKPGAAQAAADRYRGLSGAAEGRGGVQIDNTQYDADRAQELQSRAAQQFGLDSLKGTIAGKSPSVASINALGAAAGNSSMADQAVNSAHGNPAIAQTLAARGLVGADVGSASTGAIGRAGETNTALGQFSSGSNSMRTADLQRMGYSGQQAQAQAQLEAQQRAANDARSLQMEGLGNTTDYEQQQAQQAQEADNASSNLDKNQLHDAQVARQTAARDAAANAGVNAAAGAVTAGVAGYGKGGGTQSDVVSKTNIAPGGNPVNRMLDKLKPYTFDYKDPARHGEGTRSGVMAQDLEKSPMGAATVVKQPDGTRAIDGSAGLSALMASAANLHHRVKAIETKAQVPRGQDKLNGEVVMGEEMRDPKILSPKTWTNPAFAGKR